MNGEPAQKHSCHFKEPYMSSELALADHRKSRYDSNSRSVLPRSVPEAATSHPSRDYGVNYLSRPPQKRWELNALPDCKTLMQTEGITKKSL